MMLYLYFKKKAIKNKTYRLNAQITKSTMKSIKILFTLILISCFDTAISQSLNYEIKWGENIKYGLEGANDNSALNFEEAQYDFSNDKNPFLVLKLDGIATSQVELINLSVEKLDREDYVLVDMDSLKSEFSIEVMPSIIGHKSVSYLKVLPLRLNTSGEIERLTDFTLNYQGTKQKATNSKSLTFVNESALNTGEWYKIGIAKSGFYKLTYNFLSSLGIDLEEVDPRNIKLYGYGGGALPENNSVERPDDLLENAIQVAGEADGVFNKQDYIMFYGDDQVDWTFDEPRGYFRHRINPYADTTYYFINISGDRGKRIALENQFTPTSTTIVTSYNEFDYYEKDLFNLLKSGSSWVGELFDSQDPFNINFNFSDLVDGEAGKIDLSVMARAGVTSNFILNVNGQNITTPVGSVNLNRYEFRFAQAGRNIADFQPGNNLSSVSLFYDKPQTVAKGWLGWLSINVRRNLISNGSQLLFRDVNSVNEFGTDEFVTFSIQTPFASSRVFDLTDLSNIKQIPAQFSSSNISFVGNVNQLREYGLLSREDSSSVVGYGRVKNQNLHGFSQADLLIITHEDFRSAANDLAAFHESEGLTVNIATPQEIYNEYSSGAQDLIAIRTFIKMFYDRSVSQGTPPQYVVMMGDASYDYKDRIAGNTNFVPAFQSDNFLDPVSSHVSDDYFGFLDDSEGEWNINGPDRMDVAIGRFPVQTLAEASGIVNKIRAYSNPSAQRDWRNKIVFVGDDGDGVIHMDQADDLSDIVEAKGNDFNSEKIYLDAYQQQSTASGERYPDVTVDLNNAVDRGALIINYTGHGGETGWTAERVLGIFDITNWTNINNMPVFMTATCEFSRFDDPLRTSAGELVVLNPNGGGAGLMTTTRLVFSSPNYIMNRTMYDEMFKRKSNGETKRLGDIFLETKNLNAFSSNSRNFSLLGDPALKLGLPNHEIHTTSINGNSDLTADTLSALSRVTVTGEVRDINGNKLTNFNGIVYPTIFDKSEQRSTLNNDGGGVFRYNVRDSRIFKGQATVTNGDFSFSFVVPKDISYSFGTGRISYYAQNEIDDANGFEESFIIGGSSNSNIDDKLGPEIDLFMNDENFVFGGVTDRDPVLIANLSDQQGINTVGNGIGHDLVAILDEETDKAFILNDNYEAAIDDYTKGTIRFPFKDLAPGKHTLRLKAWDVANNSSEKSIEFNVVEEGEVEINNLVNYPNPFTTNTEFIFQHNQAGVPLDVKVEIFTVSGKLVKSIDDIIVSQGFVSRDIKWDGRDDFGDRIGKGVYVYKLTVRSGNGSTAEKIEKLVIL